MSADQLSAFAPAIRYAGAFWFVVRFPRIAGERFTESEVCVGGFSSRVALASLAAALGRLDGVVSTTGPGENAAGVRDLISAGAAGSDWNSMRQTEPALARQQVMSPLRDSDRREPDDCPLRACVSGALTWFRQLASANLRNPGQEPTPIHIVGKTQDRAGDLGEEYGGADRSQDWHRARHWRCPYKLLPPVPPAYRGTHLIVMHLGELLADHRLRNVGRIAR